MRRFLILQLALLPSAALACSMKSREALLAALGVAESKAASSFLAVLMILGISAALAVASKRWWYVTAIAVLAVTHPRWWISAGRGDCGDLLTQRSSTYLILAIIITATQLVRIGIAIAKPGPPTLARTG